VTAILITVAYAVGFGWQRNIIAFTGQSPVPENFWFAGIPPGVSAYLIGGAIILIMVLGYSILTSAMPRTGGGYVAISRIIGPFAGFIGSWFAFLSICVSFGVIAVLVFELAFYFIGPAMMITPMLTSFNDVGFFAGGVLLIFLVTAVAVSGSRITSYVTQALVWVPFSLGLYVLYLLAVAIANPSTLQAGISAWAQVQGVAGVTAETYVKAALAQGLDSASLGNYWTAVSASLAGAYFAYIGYANLTFVSGEVREPARNFPKIVLIAPVIVVIMFVTMASFAAYSASAVGQTTLMNGDRWSFFEAYSYLTDGGGSLQRAGLPNFRLRIPTLASMVGMGLGLGSLNILVFLFSILWVVNDLPPAILAASRIIFAMSFDGILPESLNKVNRFHSPVYAATLVGIFGVTGALSESCIFCNGGSWSPGGTLGDVLTSVFGNGIYNTDLLDVVFFSLFSLAIVLFPLRQKGTFATARFRPGGKLGVMAIGVAGLVANLVIGWTVLTSPQDAYNIISPTPDNWFALGFTALLGIIGSVIYGYYRFGPSSKTRDFSAIFSDIPPE